MSDLLPWSRFLKRRLPHRSLEFVHGLKHRANIGVCCPPHAHESIEIVYHPVGRGVTRFSGGRTLPFAEGHAVVCGFREVHDQVMERPGEDFCVHLGIPEGEGKETPPRRGFRVGPLGDPALIAEIVSLARGEIGLAPADRAIFGFRATAVLLSLIRLAETGGSQEDLEEEGKNAERHVLLAERLQSRRTSARFVRWRKWRTTSGSATGISATPSGPAARRAPSSIYGRSASPGPRSCWIAPIFH